MSVRMVARFLQQPTITTSAIATTTTAKNAIAPENPPIVEPHADSGVMPASHIPLWCNDAHVMLQFAAPW